MTTTKRQSVATRKRTAKVVSDVAVVARAPVPTDQQTLWLEQYFICGLNATEAALIAYNTTDREVAASIGSENLRKPYLRSRINERLDEFHLSANEVLARLAFMARGTMEEFIDADSQTIDLRKAKQAKKLGLIKKFKTKFITTTKTDVDGNTEDIEVAEIELELYDAQAALVHVGKHLNLWNTDTNININLTQLSDEELRQVAAGKKVVSIEASK